MQEAYLPFEQAKTFVHSLKLRNAQDWSRYCKSGLRRRDIPSQPSEVYKNEWVGWADWLLSTDRIVQEIVRQHCQLVGRYHRGALSQEIVDNLKSIGIDLTIHLPQ